MTELTRYILTKIAKSNAKPLAVIIKGNSKYTELPKIKAMADRFYQDIKSRLEANGYNVKFDAGLPYTRPDTSAVLWVGHSRGNDRLSFAPSGVETIALTDKADNSLTPDEIGMSKEHYQLSAKDLASIRLKKNN